MEGNIAYIDAQNLYLGAQSLGWKLDMKKFRIYLKEKYDVKTAYIFLGYIPENKPIYTMLKKYGYTLYFKPVLICKNKEIKGNVDGEIIMQAMIHFYENKKHKVVLVTSDGDFYCLVEHLYRHHRLDSVLSAHKKNCSVFLRRAAKEKLQFLNKLKQKLMYKKKHR